MMFTVHNHFLIEASELEPGTFLETGCAQRSGLLWFSASQGVLEFWPPKKKHVCTLCCTTIFQTSRSLPLAATGPSGPSLLLWGKVMTLGLVWPTVDPHRYPLVIEHNYWKMAHLWLICIDFLIQDCDVPLRYVSLKDGSPDTTISIHILGMGLLTIDPPNLGPKICPVKPGLFDR